MKGLVFTALEEFAPDDAVAPAGYDPFARYPHERLVALAERAAARADVPLDELLRRFGRHLFGRFAVLYPSFFVDVDSALVFLAAVNGRIHEEVGKLHPSAEFPRFECRVVDGDRLEMVYRSRRPLAALADGMIRGCVAHFGESIDVARTDDEGDGHVACFSLVRRRDPG